MGQHTSKSGGKVVGMTVATSAKAADGTDIDLRDTPLRYGDHDAAVTGALRLAVEAQERKRQGAKIEYAMGFNSRGEAIGEARGGSGSVRTPASFWPTDGLFTHNHPRSAAKGEKGMLGGTFSQEDIACFIRSPIRTMRASASEGTYSITRGAGFDGAGLKAYMTQVDQATNAAVRTKIKQLQVDYRAKKITAEQYNASAVKAVNEALVGLHNGLIAGQKQYGYTYTLERRAQ